MIFFFNTVLSYWNVDGQDFKEQNVLGIKPIYLEHQLWKTSESSTGFVCMLRCDGSKQGPQSLHFNGQNTHHVKKACHF